LEVPVKLSVLAYTSLALLTCALGACTAGSTTPVGADQPPSGTGTTDRDAGTDPAPPAPKQDAAPPPDTKPDDPMPTSPMFEVTINGSAVKVKSVSIDHTNLYPSDGTSYYEITATLDQSPPIVPGLDEDPKIVIRVGKDENGTDVCKEKRGPQVGFVQPVIELREVSIRYERFTGSSTVTAFPSTKDGSCNMALKSAAAGGHAWGEAKGVVQSSADEPALHFEAKWFQPVDWK
jgi:hypothetical protein